MRCGKWDIEGEMLKRFQSVMEVLGIDGKLHV